MTRQAVLANAILVQYAQGPAQLEAALAGIAESNLDLAAEPDAWTIRQIIHHVADGDDLWKTCLKAALGRGESSFDLRWYWARPQMEWSEIWMYASRSIASSLALLHANRRHVLDLVRSCPDAWDRSIWLQHPQGRAERITVGEILEMQARHVFEHIEEIQAIRKAHGIPETSGAA